MSKSKYSLPDCLKGKCDPAKYSRWLGRKAQAHVRRDRKRNGKDSCTIAQYKAEIHRAVLAGDGRDFYTGELLDWSIISKFENVAAKAGRSPYKKKFWLLPTVDHSFPKEKVLEVLEKHHRNQEEHPDYIASEVFFTHVEDCKCGN